MEAALADNAFDPFTGEWQSEDVRREYADEGCPVSDEQWANHLHKIGQFVPPNIRHLVKESSA